MIVYKGSDYIVLGQTEGGNYRLISGTSIGSIQCQPNQDANGNYYNIGQYDEMMNKINAMMAKTSIIMKVLLIILNGLYITNINIQKQMKEFFH